MYRTLRQREEKRVNRRALARRTRSITELFAFFLIVFLILALMMSREEIKDLKKQNAVHPVMIPVESYTEPSRGTAERVRSLGKFQIYHYCPCEKCCGKKGGITATGTKPREGETVAVDPEVIPLGSTVIIDGEEYIAEDTGGGIQGNKIDIFIGSHAEAIQKGTYQTEVFIKK